MSQLSHLVVPRSYSPDGKLVRLPQENLLGEVKAIEIIRIPAVSINNIPMLPRHIAEQFLGMRFVTYFDAWDFAKTFSFLRGTWVQSMEGYRFAFIMEVADELASAGKMEAARFILKEGIRADIDLSACKKTFAFSPSTFRYVD